MLIRVFGGVPADALAACLIASFLTAMLIGALTLLWSVRHHGWVSVALTVVSLGAYHVVVAIARGIGLARARTRQRPHLCLA